MEEKRDGNKTVQKENIGKSISKKDNNHPACLMETRGKQLKAN